jgi:peroxiredoxin Q/BCP
VTAQDKFKKKHDLGIALLSDEAHKMLEAYGAWGKKSMYGKSFVGIIRTTFLIDADGRIARIWPKVRVDGHAAEVLAAAKEL